MDFDIIITSYNRPKKVEWLARALQSNYVRKIIIVDSGNNNFDLPDLVDKVVFYASSHKNQPYQRFLGCQNATSEWILFLDDDMEPVEGWDREIDQIIGRYAHAGMIGLYFKDLHQESFLKKNTRSLSASESASGIMNMFRSFTGYPILPAGKYYKNGVKGVLPIVESTAEHVSGGAFLANRKYLYQNVNLELFSLYEKRLGKGEDGILGYSMSKVAPVFFYPKQLFWHNDQGNSVYTQNHYQFNRVVAFSRLYLNKEYYRLNQLPRYMAKLSFINYSFWRLFGLVINAMFKPSKIRFNALKGYFMGTIKALYYPYNNDLSSCKVYWNNEAENDSRSAKRGGYHV